MVLALLGAVLRQLAQGQPCTCLPGRPTAPLPHCRPPTACSTRRSTPSSPPRCAMLGLGHWCHPNTGAVCGCHRCPTCPLALLRGSCIRKPSKGGNALECSQSQACKPHQRLLNSHAPCWPRRAERVELAARPRGVLSGRGWCGLDRPDGAAQQRHWQQPVDGGRWPPAVWVYCRAAVPCLLQLGCLSWCLAALAGHGALGRVGVRFRFCLPYGCTLSLGSWPALQAGLQRAPPARACLPTDTPAPFHYLAVS